MPRIRTQDADGRPIYVFVDDAVAAVLAENPDSLTHDEREVLSLSARNADGTGLAMFVEAVPAADSPIDALMCERPLGLDRYTDPKVYGEFWQPPSIDRKRGICLVRHAATWQSAQHTELAIWQADAAKAARRHLRRARVSANADKRANAARERLAHAREVKRAQRLAANSESMHIDAGRAAALAALAGTDIRYA